MAGQRRSYQTQWAAQFFAAAELTRRGYLVALTLGNAQRADLLVESQTGEKFSVDVKGLKTHNWWLVTERDDHPDYYILVYVPKPGNPPEYFLLSGAEMATEMNLVRQSALAKGQVWTGRGSGIHWSTGAKYQDRWGVLPG
ncbi:MAG: hypothetical protein NT169_23365 [Chloroflexi bacterium]|nr:hypothetical protein [Chloroflexota bacterium]